MPVIGTAGHVDHGKSTLVLTLTGRDPDRWAEEKTRGLTIDLGFAWSALPSGVEVSFVDVPGHEQFMKNMLAGIESVDIALLVVAADEGWMPQSEEHLVVLDLLGAAGGVVALTKTDRVDDELVELATLEIEERLEGTSLAGAAVIPVSAHTGSGIDELRTELDRLVSLLSPEPEGRPRLWIDRSFSISGAGTVVTGTLLGGSVSTGDKLAVWPGPLEGRVRSIQSHEQDMDRTGPRRRVALNLAGLDRGQIGRGAMAGRRQQWAPTARFSAAIKAARYVEQLTDKGAYHLHVGSGAWPIRLRMLSDAVALIELPETLPLQMGDRFIVRETGRRLVMGGGTVLDPAPPRRGSEALAGAAALTAALEQGTDAMAEALLEVRGSETVTTLDAHTGGGQVGNAVRMGDTLMTNRRVAELVSAATGRVDEFHRANPLRPGMPIASLASALGLPAPVMEGILERSPDLEAEAAVARRSGFVVDRGDRDAEWAEARSKLVGDGVNVPRIAELGIDRELLHALVRDGELVKISDEFVFLPSQIQAITDELAGMESGFTVSEFKDRTGLSRKYAVPFLEWADRTGLTVRMGDTRRLRS
ncbi:MAG: selenocysteine-specific translation elongation factor [Acidimicrobiia bacterium]